MPARPGMGAPSTTLSIKPCCFLTCMPSAEQTWPSPRPAHRLSFSGKRFNALRRSKSISRNCTYKPARRPKCGGFLISVGSRPSTRAAAQEGVNLQSCTVLRATTAGAAAPPTFPQRPRPVRDHGQKFNLARRQSGAGLANGATSTKCRAHRLPYPQRSPSSNDFRITRQIN